MSLIVCRRIQPILLCRSPREFLRFLHNESSNLVKEENTNNDSTGGEQEEEELTDLLIVGAGPAGLSAAIRAKQLDASIRVMIVEKASEVGAHTISGNIFEPRALDELIPDWRSKGDAPIQTRVSDDKMMLLINSNYSIPLPHPPLLNNTNNFIISLGLLVRWLAIQAEALGVEIYPGFPASRPLLSKTEPTRLLGVITGETGVLRNSTKGPQYAPGMKIVAHTTLLAEGCHGSLTKKLIPLFGLRNHLKSEENKKNAFQTHGLGLKEVWEVPESLHKPGLVRHTVGWPTDNKTYQGGFLYHWSDATKDSPGSGRRLVSLGLVVGLDYWNPHLRPYMEFQRWKHHPKISQHLVGGKCISYGARTLIEGGIQSLPNLEFSGGALIGCAAGTMNVPKIKGTHTAMKSGMLAAEAAVANILDKKKEPSSMNTKITEPVSYQKLFEKSWVHKELHAVRNVRPGFHMGLYLGLLNAGFETMVTRGYSPWTLKHNKPDHETLSLAKDSPLIEYPIPDGVLSFNLLENLSRSGTDHNQDQPSHLRVTDPNVHVIKNLSIYGGPEQNYCPAGVYEYIDSEPYKLPDGSEATKKLQINAPNCLHCKTCDIKDPSQSINWTTPEGGGGPNYAIM